METVGNDEGRDVGEDVGDSVVGAGEGADEGDVVSVGLGEGAIVGVGVGSLDPVGAALSVGALVRKYVSPFAFRFSMLRQNFVHVDSVVPFR